MDNFGEVSRVRGEYEQAQSYYQQSEALFRDMGDAGELARLVQNLGYIALHRGDLEGAEIQFRDSLAMFVKLSNQRGIAESLSAIAGCWIEGGDCKAGAQLFGEAENLLDQTGCSWWPADRVEIERITDKLENNMTKEDLERNIAVGKLMTLETAVSMVQVGN
jgi:tetratricopeptide (TPR) repeat protein